MAKNNKDSVTGEVKEVFGVLSDNGTARKIFGMVAWNDRPAKAEIRTIVKKHDGSEMIGKGIALSDEELEALVTAYKKKKKRDDANKPVDFNDIFGAAPDIVSKREHGQVTKDGFVVLQETGELAEKAKKYKK